MPSNRVPAEAAIDSDDALLEALSENKSVESILRADSRILARVTDGIYREPTSALRELIANAYDADATKVTVTTDRPRFERIVVDDNGLGMTKETLVHLIHHIGGSAKRSVIGQNLGVTDEEDVGKSPAGRELIGKIGIGLFSVAQLTRRFQVITKTAGSTVRLVADINLKQYSETAEDSVDGSFEAGLVTIWTEPADDPNSHGTTIVLSSIRPSSVEILRGASDWERVLAGDRPAPPFHVGFYDLKDKSLVELAGETYASLPWNKSDSPAASFRKLVGAVHNYEGKQSTPKKAEILDPYLNMLWDLGLSMPLDYVGGHPFSLTTEDIRAFHLPGNQPDGAIELEASSETTVGGAAGSELSKRSSTPPFKVVVDDVQLFHPLKFVELGSTTNKVKEPSLFVGSLNETFDGVSVARSGGPLRAKAYILWAPRVVPLEHRGVLIRIRGASGTGFDVSFLKWPTAENTKKSQMSCEIFVEEGLDAALNIDRESFNEAHPHYVRLSHWMHTALTRAVTMQKRIESRARAQNRDVRRSDLDNAVSDVVVKHWQESGADGDEVPQVEFVPKDTAATADIVYPSEVLPAVDVSERSVAVRREVTAIIQLLTRYELLEKLSSEEQRSLVAAIGRVLNAAK